MIYLQQHIEKLGQRVKDRVTGLEGIVTSVSFDLYGCIQATVHPGLDGDGKPREVNWFDMNRLAVIDATPAMEQPNFAYGPVAEGRKGPAEKPVCKV